MDRRPPVTLPIILSYGWPSSADALLPTLRTAAFHGCKIVLIHFGCAFQFVQTNCMVCIDFNCSCQIFIFNFMFSSTFCLFLVFARLVCACCNQNNFMKQLSNMNDDIVHCCCVWPLSLPLLLFVFSWQCYLYVLCLVVAH